MWDLIISVIAGIIVGYFVAFFKNKFQRRQWLIQKRSEIFPEFLKILEKCKDETFKFNREGHPDGFEKTQQVLDLYQPAFSYAKITRLFLKEKSKKRFDDLVNQLYAFHASEGLGDQRFRGMVNCSEGIQKILEENLQDAKW